MSEEIKTPRTDALGTISFASPSEAVQTVFSHARQLERDLALATQERDALKTVMEHTYYRHQSGEPRSSKCCCDICKTLRALKTKA